MTDLVFDPGVTTGVALMEPGKVLWTDTCVKLLDLGNLVDLARMTTSVDRIIYEEYIIFAGKAHSHINSRVYPIQVVGVIRFLAYTYHIPLVPLQPRVKAAVPSDIFQKAVLTAPPNKTLSEHEKDAVKLGLYQQLLEKNA